MTQLGKASHAVVGGKVRAARDAPSRHHREDSFLDGRRALSGPVGMRPLFEADSPAGHAVFSTFRTEFHVGRSAVNSSLVVICAERQIESVARHSLSLPTRSTVGNACRRSSGCLFGLRSVVSDPGIQWTVDGAAA